MKKKLLFAVIFLTINVGLLIAQTNQGNVLVGVSSTLSLAGTGSDLMNLGFSSVKYKSDADGYDEPDADKMTNINLLPKFGYFFIDNLALGLGVNIALSTNKDGEDNDKYSQTLLSVEPFMRYYIPTAKVFPFFELSGSFGSIKNKFESDDWGDEEYESSVMSIGGGVGIAAPLGDKVTFDVMAGYNSLTVKDKEDNDDNDRTVIGTFGLKLGFTILLGSN